MDGTSPFRESGGDPDLDARESDAIAAFGRWSMRLRTAWLFGFAIVGVVAGFLAAALAIDVWQREMDPRPPRIIYVGALALTLVVFLFVGRAVGRVVVRHRTPHVLARLAVRYEVTAKRLAETTDLANQV